MTDLLRVLIRFLARFLRGCADFLSRRAETDAAAPGLSSTTPPEDWVRRANPPPPAHWIALVRRRAPQLLASLPDRRPPLSRPQTPGPGIRSRSPQAAPSGPAAASAELQDRRGGPVEAGERRQKGPFTPSHGGEGKRRRVVTSVEEARPSRIPEAPATDPAKAAKREAAPPPPAVPGEPSETPLPVPLDPRRPVPRPEPVPGVPMPPRFDSVEEPAVDACPFDLPAPAFEVPPERSPFGSPSSTGRTPATNNAVRFMRRINRTPSGLCDAETGQAEGEEGRWPELPAAPESDRIDDCLALVREQRRLETLDAEQRGMPWSA